MLKKSRNTFPLPVAVLAVVVTLLCGSAGAGDGVGKGAGVIYYQVTFDNGTVRDLTEIPKSRKGIRRVLRIARFDADFKGYQVISTEGPALRLVHTGRTVKQDLAWNGAAWVAPQEGSSPSPPPPDPPATSAIKQETRRVEAVLKALKERLKQLDHTAAEEERELASRKGTEPEAAAAQNLTKTAQDRKKLLETIEQYKRTLEVLKDGKDHSRIPPTGKVERLRRPPEKSDFGIVTPTTKKAVLPHRVHVWKLPPGKGKRTYAVSMKHPEAGRLGAFRYVAYADTNGDGAPDKFVAQSDLASAKTPGEWTQWTFSTSSPSVFAGCAWTEPTAGVYCQRTSPDNKNWRGTDVEVYTAPYFGAVPRERWGKRGRKRGGEYWPYLGNIRIRVNQNPDSPSGGPAVIFR